MSDKYLDKEIVFEGVFRAPIKGKERRSCIPTTPGFIGRAGELQRLKEEIERCHIFIIKGIAGCGKTYLAAHFAHELKDRYNIFYGECSENLGLSILFREINDFLVAQGEIGFDLILKESSLEIGHKIKGLIDVLERGRFLLIFDDFSCLKEEELIEPMTLFDRFLEKSRLILLCRKTPLFLKDLRPNNVFEISLGGLTEDEATKYLGNLTSLKDEAIMREVSKRTCGLPLALNLYGLLSRYYNIEELLRDIPGYAKEVIDQNLIDRVFSILDEDEIQMLTSFSVFRRPVCPKVLSYLYQGDWEKVFIGLIDKLQLNRMDDGRITMHPLIREFAYKRCKEKRRCHLIAARAYSLDGGLDNALEAYYHYIEADELSYADEIVTRIGDELIRSGSIDLAYRMVKNSLKGISQENPKLHMLLGKILQIWGRFNEAIFEYDWALRHFTDLKDKALAKNQVGGAYLYKGDYKKAKAFLEESLNLRKRISDERGVAEGLHQMGVLNLVRGDYSKALEYLEESLVMTRSFDDKGAVSQTLNEIARAHFYKKEYEMSLQRLNEALSLSRELKDRYTEATILHNMGSVYLETADYKRSEGLFKESLRIREEIGDRLGLARSLYQMGNLYFEKGGNKEAIDYLEKSRSIFKELGSDDERYPKLFLDIIRGCKTVNAD